MKDAGLTEAGLLALYDRVAEAEDAIPRLRRFVLDLAVRGKLVPQDARDEPASVLLEKIDILASGSAQSGRTRRDTSAGNQLEDEPFDMPADWTFAPLSRLVRVLNGRAYKQQELLNAGTPVLRVGNLFTSNHWYYSDLALEDDKYCDKGDLIYAWSASFGPFIWDGPKVIYHYHIWKLPLHSEQHCSKQYLYTYLLQKTREIKEAGHGISMVHMTKEKMEKLLVRLPPLAEQHRIVAKVEELMALLDRLEAARAAREETRTRLTAATLSRLTEADADTPTAALFALQTLPALTTRPNQIKTLRQTIFNLAVRGKLVEQDAGDEPLEARLPALRKVKAAAETNEGIRARAPLERIKRADLWFEIPANWALPSFDDLFVIVSGVTKGQRVNPADAVEVPYLRVANVQRGYVDLNTVKTIVTSKSDATRYGLHVGDVLMTEGGDWDKLGRAAIWSGQIPSCIHQNHVFRVRVPFQEVLPTWTILYANSTLGRRYFEDASKQTTNLASINMTQLRGCPLPLPPLAEQHRIVAKVDELMSLCDRLETALRKAATARARLLDATLREALHQTEPA